ncbi:MAG: VirB3 family type IV secretion system protein [Legionellales bacterium]|nr:VirB3 family type IV secretion system protein [Legionellales bacterium]
MQAKNFPLFKGATRLPIFLGVPVTPLFVVAMVIAMISMFKLWCWLLLPPAVIILQQITKHDDRIFRLWALYLDTTLRNRYRHVWRASSYSLMAYRKRKNK